MGELESGSERRRAVRAPLRGIAVVHEGDVATQGAIENLSASGALVTIASMFTGDHVDLELQLGAARARVRARAVRVDQVEPPRGDVDRIAAGEARVRVAVAFDALDPALRATIDAAIDGALRRPIVVLADEGLLRHELVTRLRARGLSPLVPGTPLEAMELLARAPLQVNICLIAPSFGESAAELRALVADSFPWVTTAEISDELDATVEAAVAAWASAASRWS